MSLGGPIKKNRLWFVASYRDWGVYQYIANSFFDWGPKGPNFPRTTPAGTPLNQLTLTLNGKPVIGQRPYMGSGSIDEAANGVCK